ncbi:hypothetical protein EYF80_045275 [Liparis tanakae]|uniref:Uncharacterized protein n=1 Tax=Liparis tanakae TaxID=230148 RepID=A0A4Z2FTL5_9TELE|nr:hypothetical protein EYF80_045275 [Liparis tanakae]
MEEPSKARGPGAGGRFERNTGAFLPGNTSYLDRKHELPGQETQHEHLVTSKSRSSRTEGQRDS